MPRVQWLFYDVGVHEAGGAGNQESHEGKVEVEIGEVEVETVILSFVT